MFSCCHDTAPSCHPTPSLPPRSPYDTWLYPSAGRPNPFFLSSQVSTSLDRHLLLVHINAPFRFTTARSSSSAPTGSAAVSFLDPVPSSPLLVSHPISSFSCLKSPFIIQPCTTRCGSLPPSSWPSSFSFPPAASSPRPCRSRAWSLGRPCPGSAARAAAGTRPCVCPPRRRTCLSQLHRASASCRPCRRRWGTGRLRRWLGPGWARIRTRISWGAARNGPWRWKRSWEVGLGRHLVATDVAARPYGWNKMCQPTYRV